MATNIGTKAAPAGGLALKNLFRIFVAPAILQMLPSCSLVVLAGRKPLSVLRTKNPAKFARKRRHETKHALRQKDCGEESSALLCICKAGLI